MTEKEGPPDMDALSLDSGDEGVMIGDKEDMFASALGDPPQVYLTIYSFIMCQAFNNDGFQDRRSRNLTVLCLALLN